MGGSMAVGLAVLSACSSGGSSSKSTSTTKASTAESGTVRPLTVLVTNDDGYGAAGIDTMVTALRALPGVTVTVVAPSGNRSGSGGKTTPGELTATNQATKSNYPATSVEGYPVDAVTYGLAHVLTQHPDLVVSGINEGQNLGPLTTISGTVGAAETAASAGIPALAVSVGLGTAGAPPDYATVAQIATGWITADRGAIVNHKAPVVVLNVNVPTCPTGTVRGIKQVPLASDLSGRDITVVNCSSDATHPPDDVAAFLDGFASVTSLKPDGKAVTTTTSWTSQ